jgi:hypothetical protein
MTEHEKCRQWGIRPNHITYRTLLHCCLASLSSLKTVLPALSDTHNAGEAAEAILNDKDQQFRRHEIAFPPTKRHYRLAIYICERADDWDRAQSLTARHNNQAPASETQDASSTMSSWQLYDDEQRRVQRSNGSSSFMGSLLIPRNHNLIEQLRSVSCLMPSTDCDTTGCRVELLASPHIYFLESNCSNMFCRTSFSSHNLCTSKSNIFSYLSFNVACRWPNSSSLLLIFSSSSRDISG